MVKKPRHDPATAWKKPDQSAYQRYATPAMARGYSSYRVRWEDVAVGATVGLGQVVLENPTEAIAQLADYTTRYEFSDGSAGLYDPVSQTITKTRAASPLAPTSTPEEIEEIEETTEVITAWRVFGIQDYKLRGIWSTWESRVFHASCNCEYFDGATIGVTVLPLHPERRDDMRRHLVAGTGTCGVYSRKHLNPFWEPKAHYHLIIEGRAVEVLAQCVNYGLGYEYDGGYRSEYARIEHLWLLANGPLLDYEGYIRHAEGHDGAVSPATVAQILSTTYEVPCDVVTPVEFAYKQEAGLL